MRLAAQPTSAVLADDDRRERGALRQLNGLSEPARRHVHLVSARTEVRDKRTEERHVRRVREINPDTQDSKG